MVSLREGALEEASRHATALEALARPRGMRSFLARALWIRAAAAHAGGTAFDVTEAIALARGSEELLVLRSLLAVAGSPEAEEVTAAMARSMTDPTLRGRFLSASRV